MRGRLFAMCLFLALLRCFSVEAAHFRSSLSRSPTTSLYRHPAQTTAARTYVTVTLLTVPASPRHNRKDGNTSTLGQTVSHIREVLGADVGAQVVEVPIDESIVQAILPYRRRTPGRNRGLANASGTHNTASPLQTTLRTPCRRGTGSRTLAAPRSCRPSRSRPGR